MLYTALLILEHSLTRTFPTKMTHKVLSESILNVLCYRYDGQTDIAKSTFFVGCYECSDTVSYGQIPILFE